MHFEILKKSNQNIFGLDYMLNNEEIEKLGFKTIKKTRTKK